MKAKMRKVLIISLSWGFISTLLFFYAHYYRVVTVASTEAGELKRLIPSQKGKQE